MLSDINVNCTKLFDDICVTLFTAITYKSFASVFALVFPSLSRLRGSKTFLLTTHRVQMSSALHSKCESRKMGRGICPVYIVQPFKLVFAVFVKDSKIPQWMVDLFTAEGARFLRNFTLKVILL